MEIKNKVTQAQAWLNGMAVAALTFNPYTVLAEGEGLKTGILDYDVANGNMKGKDVSNNAVDVFNQVNDKGRILVSGITGFAAIALTIIFIISAVKLGSSGDNPNERSRAVQKLIWLFVSIALLGGISIWTGLAWGLFK